MTFNFGRKKMTLERAARIVLHGDDEEDTDEFRVHPATGKRPVPSLCPVPWLQRRLEFWDDQTEFARACA